MGLLDTLLYYFLNPMVKRHARKSMPQLDGVIPADSLKKPVKVYRDQWGVPHIYAENMEDLVYVQGYVHAQDRLWQMDITRRVARGQLSEVVGKDGLPTDRATKTLGFERLAFQDLENLSKDLNALLHRYVDGINDQIDRIGKNMPPEYKLLKYAPVKWEPVDILAMGRMLGWQMSFAWFSEIVRAKMIDEVGYERAMELELHYPEHNPAGLDKIGEVNIILDDGRLEGMQGPFLKPVQGSNAWAIASWKSKTGHPFLCNDPHLPMSQPAIWYENHIACPKLECTGVSIPGIPLVMIGHNRDIAWGMTLAFTDIQDLYIEKFTDDNFTHYEFKGEVREATKITEVIKVKGQEDHHEEVVLTHHGPIISDVTGFEHGKLSLASSALKQSGMIEGWFKLNKASDWNSFVEAMGMITAPALNVPYADTKGNIGYWVTGEVPIRARDTGMTPGPGWTGDAEWTGMVPFEEMPHAFNPEKGHIITCNHKIIGDDYPHYLGNAWMNGYRANRLEQLLSVKETYGFEDMKRFQQDTQCIPGQLFAQHFKGLRMDNLNLEQLKQYLLSWDGNLTVDSIGGMVYELTKHFMFHLLFDEKMGAELVAHLRGTTFNDNLIPQNEFYGHDTSVILRLLDKPESWWIQEAGGKDKLMRRSLAKTYEYLNQNYGPEPRDWAWGKVHKISFHHPAGDRKALARIFNQGPFEIPGNTDTLLQTATMAFAPLSDHVIAPSYRQIIDMKDFTRSVSVMPPGQSANILSEHYNDQLDMWRKGVYHPMLWDRNDIQNRHKHLLELMPSA